MATGTGGIATQLNANTLYTDTTGNLLGPYQDHAERNRCVTYASAISAGFTVANASRYTSNTNRLVRYSDLSCSAPLRIRLTINISSDSTLYNNGPITFTPAGARVNLDPILPRAAAPKIEDVREVESLEITDNDVESLPMSYNEDTLLNKNQTEYSVDKRMTLMSVDEVLQIADEYERETIDNIYGAVAVLLGVTLTKDGGVNLLTDTSYGPSAVLNSNKTVTFTLINKPAASSSDYGQYVLTHKGAAMSYLVNSSGLCPAGGLYVLNSTSSAQNQSITISGPGTYTFNAYWIKRSGSVTPDPSTPTTTYTFRLRFALDGIAVYQVYVKFECTIYSSTGAVLGTCNVPGTAYRPYELPADKAVINTQSYYYIDLWTGTTAPTYVKVSNAIFRHNANNLGNWLVTDYDIQNRGFFGSSPSLSGSGLAYYTLNPRGNIYSVDYLVGGGALEPIDPVLPR